MTTSIPPQDKAVSRRAWIPQCIRGALLAGMAAFGIGQVYKGQRLATDPDCIKLTTCTDCVEFGGCNLDKAAASRISQGKS
ncbi:hypothetical protein OAM01_00705 [bacterium]|nr:hypothetical protein [bacterium]